MQYSASAPSGEQFIACHRDFLSFLAGFRQQLPTLRLSEIVGADPGHVAMVTVDVIKGFCSQGAMCSPRVAAIVPAVKRIIQAADQAGVRHFLFTCDTHTPDSREFDTWPAHCVAGTPESELEDDLLRLPGSDKFVMLPKPSINSLIDTELADTLEAIQPRVIIAMGDVTDLCYYQLATNLKMLANARGWNCRVIAPLSAIETYDTPMATAQQLGILPHDGDFINAFFAYHLQATGVEVVQDLR